MWLTLLTPFIPTIVTAVEKLFGKKNGPAKLDTAQKILQTIIDALGSFGKLPGGSPIPTDLIAEINKVVGVLFPSGTTVPAGDTSVPSIDLGSSNSITKDSLKKLI